MELVSFAFIAMKLHFANAIESLTKHFQVNSLSGQACRTNTILKFQCLIPQCKFDADGRSDRRFSFFNC